MLQRQGLFVPTVLHLLFPGAGGFAAPDLGVWGSWWQLCSLAILLDLGNRRVELGFLFLSHMLAPLSLPTWQWR